MNALLLISIILGVSFQNVVKKPFSQKASGKGVYFFLLYDKPCGDDIFRCYVRGL